MAVIVIPELESDASLDVSTLHGACSIKHKIENQASLCSPPPLAYPFLPCTCPLLITFSNLLRECCFRRRCEIKINSKSKYLLGTTQAISITPHYRSAMLLLKCMCRQNCIALTRRGERKHQRCPPPPFPEYLLR